MYERLAQAFKTHDFFNIDIYPSIRQRSVNDIIAANVLNYGVRSGTNEFAEFATYC